MATIYKRNSCYYLNWFEGGLQQRKSLGAITESEADTIKKAKEIELATGRRIFVGSALFDHHLGRYLEWHAIEFPSSHSRIKQIAKDCFEEFRNRKLFDIDTAMCERWKTSRIMRIGRLRTGDVGTVSSETAAKEWRTLKAVMRKAVLWGEIDRSPCDGIRAPKNLTSRPIVWFSKAELAQLYTRPNGHLWRFIANTGMRLSEVMHLKPEDIDLAAGVVRILSEPTARTKSAKWRQVPLSGAAKDAAATLLEACQGKKYVVRRIWSNSLARELKKDLKRFGLKGSTHSLRHSYGAHMVMAGVPIRALQVLMGHASVTTTERYAHVAQDYMQSVAVSI
jgi:integrase